jgi:hypothetical protein
MDGKEQPRIAWIALMSRFKWCIGVGGVYITS